MSIRVGCKSGSRVHADSALIFKRLRFTQVPDTLDAMRIALVLVIALAAAGCAKKSKPAAAPAAAPPAAESSPAGAPNDTADEAPGGGPKDGTQSTGDPCDGGETKAKK